MIRYEKAIRKRLENLNGRKLILYGDDNLTEYILEDLKKMHIFVDARMSNDEAFLNGGGEICTKNIFYTSSGVFRT